MEKFNRKLVDTIIDGRYWIISLIVILIAASLFEMSRLTVDNDTMKSVPADFKEMIKLNQLQETFSTPFNMLFIAKFDSGTIYEKCETMKKFAKRFESIESDGVKGVKGTYYLGKAKIPTKGGFFGINSNFIIPQNSNLSEDDITKRLSDNKKFTTGLISDDQKVLGMIILFSPDVPRPLSVGQISDIKDSLDAAGEFETYITGATTIPYFLNKKMRKDFAFLLPSSFIVSAILLFIIFQSALFVFASLLIIAIAVIFTFAIMSITGIHLSVVTSVIPVILFPIGIADSIHVIKTYKYQRWKLGLSLKEAFTETYRELLRPIILTSITTFFGFGSFLFSEITWTRHFGIFTGIGVIIALLLTVLMLPLFALLDKPNDKKIKQRKSSGANNSFDLKFRSLIFNSMFPKIFLVVVLIISIYGITKVRYESNPISMFSKNSTIRKADKLISSYFGGTRFFYLTLTSKDKITTVKHWEEIDSICKIIESDSIIGNVSSIVPLLNRTSELLNKKPISRAAISLLLKGKGIFGKNFGGMINSNIDSSRTKIKISITAKNISGFDYTGLASRIGNDIELQFPNWKVDEAGPALLIDAMITLIIHTQITSLLIAFISVFIVLMILYRSFRVGFYTTIPIILSTMFVYALMGLSGVAINTMTVIVVNTSIGIGIDYAIHFTSGFMYIKDNFNNAQDALLETVKSKGNVIILNTFVVGLGFLVLVFSSFPPIRFFGLFIFISMVTSSLFSLLLLPLFFKNYNKSI